MASTRDAIKIISNAFSDLQAYAKIRGLRLSRESVDVLEEARKQLMEYFSSKRTGFSLPLDPDGTEFQISVWDAAKDIRYGSVTTYAEIGKKLGRPRAYRAVGAALRRNPLIIVIPCHRVVMSDGRLGGYSAGLKWKSRLLSFERSNSRTIGDKVSTLLDRSKRK